MDPWQSLNSELDSWASNDRVADLWWRDDDAVATGAQLDKLLSITETTGLLLAVIPAKAEPALATVVQAAPQVVVAQHGYAHINHAPRGQGRGAWELGLHRGDAIVLDELDEGRRRLEDLFADNFIPVIVPPWNHMDAELFTPVVARGFSGVSRFGPRQSAALADGFAVVNSHCDLIRWKNGAEFKGTAKTINQLVEHLQNRRTGVVDATEPTGFLTHHLDMDDAGWAFSEQLVQCINEHPAACWCNNVGQLFETQS